MKKLFFSIALAAVVGTVSYFSMHEKADDIVLNPMELANIEALGFDEGDPAITCNYPTRGFCWVIAIGSDYCNGQTYLRCVFTGNQYDTCFNPCTD